MPKQQYNESSIEIMEGLEAVRKRPGMYIGSTDSRGLHYLVWEIVDNAVDEALNGFGNEIRITLNKDNSVTVQDQGRGMPVGKHASGVSALQVIFTVLHAGGKFSSQGGYRSSGGLHGVGASVVNALSKWCKATIYDGKDIWSMTFEDGGKKIGKLVHEGKTNRTGSTVQFLPDYALFKDKRFSFSRICDRAQEDAFLLKGLKMVVIDNRKDKRERTFEYENGLEAFIQEVNEDRTPMHDPISFSGEVNDIKVEGCFQYTDQYHENIFSFANMVRTVDGGSHETGARQAFTKVFNEYAKKNNFLKEKDKGFEGNDVREGLTLVINLTIPEQYLQFEGQTKGKLGTPEARPATENIVSENLRYFLEENKNTADALVRKIIQAANARNAARKARDESRKGKGKQRTEKILSGKLASAQSKDARRKELYLVEGDSAGGSAKQGRDSKYQAILPLRGKVLNTEKAKLDAIQKNEELNTIIHALGAGVGESFSAQDSNYHKVIIMTDADDDGAHIQNLLLTFFFRYMRELIEQRMLYIALPPLYRIAKGKEEYYLYSDEELNIKRKELKGGYTLTRYKGLGEMNASQLWETTMNPETRTLLCVDIENASLAERHVAQFMGDRADLRRSWIEDNVEFTLEDDYTQEVND